MVSFLVVLFIGFYYLMTFILVGSLISSDLFDVFILLVSFLPLIDFVDLILLGSDFYDLMVLSVIVCLISFCDYLFSCLLDLSLVFLMSGLFSKFWNSYSDFLLLSSFLEEAPDFFKS